MMHSVELRRHPSTPSDAVQRVEACVRWAHPDTLAFTFSIDGDVTRLRIPAARVHRFAHLLWQHTCLEAFVAVAATPAYHEFNFAPSGEWAAYAFRDYRDGAPLEDEALAPRIAARQTAVRLELDAFVAVERLSALHLHQPLRLALAAVIEDANGALSYWSLHHPPGLPDFHHTDAFALRLEPACDLRGRGP